MAKKVQQLTIRLQARDFYAVIVDEGEARIHTTHASFLGEPGGPDPLRPARRSIYRRHGALPLRDRGFATTSKMAIVKCACFRMFLVEYLYFYVTLNFQTLGER